MATVLDCGPLWACVDCIMFIANDDADDAHRARFAAWQETYGDGAHLVPGDDEETFSRARCDGCGSELAGTRHEFFALVD